MSNRALTGKKLRELEAQEEAEEKEESLFGGVGSNFVQYIPVVGQFLSAGNKILGAMGYKGKSGGGVFGSGDSISPYLGGGGKKEPWKVAVGDWDNVSGSVFGLEKGGQIKPKAKKRKSKRVVRGVGVAKRGYGKATYSKKMYQEIINV